MTGEYIVLWDDGGIRNTDFKIFKGGTSEENLKAASKHYEDIQQKNSTYSYYICEIIKSINCG